MWLAISPLILAAAWLVAILAGAPLEVATFQAGTLLPAVLVTSLVVAVLAGRRVTTVACALAPLSVLGAWTLVPGWFDPGTAGFDYFVHWSTQYPTAGPFNLDVLLGLGCVLGASAMPVAFAIYRMRAATPSRWRMGALFALFLVAYVPVVIELDLALLVCSALTVPDGLTVAAEMGGGALLRAAAAVAMLAALIRPRPARG